MIYNSVYELIGNTPLIRLADYEQRHGLGIKVLAKLELFNPAGSSKDRAAAQMLDKAQQDGLISEGSVIIEPTSGNTGIALAALAATRGYELILTMPESMSIERRKLLEAYGAQLVLTDAAKGMAGAVEKAQELKKRLPGSVILEQFSNPANAQAHYLTTGPELWRDSGANIDILIACVGTGGTLTGAGQYLKECNPKIQIVAVEPAASPLLSKGYSGAHGIQGIGANFVPELLDRQLIDEVAAVTDEDAKDTAKELAQKHGILCGISSGAALAAARIIGSRHINSGKTAAVIFPDTGERYLG